MEKLLTPNQALEILQVSRRTLDRMIEDGYIRCIKTGKGKNCPIRFIPSELSEDIKNMNRPIEKKTIERPSRMKYIPGMKIV